jgi:hypothetical protein
MTFLPSFMKIRQFIPKLLSRDPNIRVSLSALIKYGKYATVLRRMSVGVTSTRVGLHVYYFNLLNPQTGKRT